MGTGSIPFTTSSDVESVGIDGAHTTPWVTSVTITTPTDDNYRLYYSRQ